MFDKCPRCNRFVTRFEFKFPFWVSGDKEYIDRVKDKLGDYVDKQLCDRCRRKLRRKEASMFFTHHLLIPILQSELDKEAKISLSMAALEGFTKR